MLLSACFSRRPHDDCIIVVGVFLDVPCFETKHTCWFASTGRASQQVDVMQNCGCFSSLEAGELTKPPGREQHLPIQPGCGCDRPLVETIREDMQARVDVRGNVGQIKQLEKMMAKFGDFAAEIPLMLDKVGADTSYPPSQQTMMAVYGERGPDIRPPTTMPHESPSQSFPTRNFNVRNEFPGLFSF